MIHVVHSKMQRCEISIAIQKVAALLGRSSWYSRISHSYFQTIVESQIVRVSIAPNSILIVKFIKLGVTYIDASDVNDDVFLYDMFSSISVEGKIFIDTSHIFTIRKQWTKQRAVMWVARTFIFDFHGRTAKWSQHSHWEPTDYRHGIYPLFIPTPTLPVIKKVTSTCSATAAKIYRHAITLKSTGLRDE